MWNWFESDQGQYRSFRIKGVKECSHYIICYNWKDMMHYDMHAHWWELWLCLAMIVVNGVIILRL